MANFLSVVKKALTPGVSKEQLRRMDAALAKQEALCERTRVNMHKYDEMLARTKKDSAEQTKTLGTLMEKMREERPNVRATQKIQKLGA